MQTNLSELHLFVLTKQQTSFLPGKRPKVIFTVFGVVVCLFFRGPSASAGEAPKEDFAVDRPPADGPADSGAASEILGSPEPVSEEELTTLPFFTADVGGGYTHPVGDISKRYGPAGLVHLSTVFSGTRFGAGLDLKLALASESDDRVTIPPDMEWNDEPLTLHATPMMIHLGISFRYAIVRTPKLLLSAGASVGVSFYQLNFKGTGDALNQYEEYRRERIGVLVYEEIELAYLPLKTFGFYLAVGLGEGKSWNDDGVQPDLGEEDDTDFGLELWPYVAAGLKLYVPTVSPLGKEMTELMTKRPLSSRGFRIDMGFGYAHPLGRVSKRHPPGLAFTAEMLFRPLFFETGLFVNLVGSTDCSDPVVLPTGSQDNPHNRPKELECEPSALVSGFVFNPLVLTKGDFLLSVGVRLGILVSFIGRGADVETDSTYTQRTAAFKSYRRERLGIALGQHVDGTWFFFKDWLGTVGLMLKISLDEAYSWSLKKHQPDLDGPDTKRYGLEWWPSVTAGINVML